MKSSGEKTALRKKMRKVRASIHDGQCAGDEFSLCSKLLNLPAVRNAKTICVYKAYDSEFSLDNFVDELRVTYPHVQIAFPAVLDEERMEFSVVQYGETPGFLQHPYKMYTDGGRSWIKPQDIDLMLVPGLAFDIRGHRLGQGGGYYDRYLARMNNDNLVLGIAFKEQVIEEVPHEENDMRVGYVVTPASIVAC